MFNYDDERQRFKSAFNKTSRPGFLTRLRNYLRRNRLGEVLVQRGVLSPDQLRHALKAHEGETRPFGQFLIAQAYATQADIAKALRRQACIRALAACATLFVTMTSFGTKSARAGNIEDVAGSIALDSGRTTYFKPIAHYPKLFGAGERRSSDLSAFTKWSGMFDRFERHIRGASNDRTIMRWRQDMIAYQHLDLPDMARKVNDYINANPYKKDISNWGKSDFWASPVEFFRRGGDCEDYAIAKYASLRMLGIPENRMRIAIVQDTVKNTPHAVLIVYTDDGGLVLDNQDERARGIEAVDRYDPIFSINRMAWWLHSTPGKTVLASAAK